MSDRRVNDRHDADRGGQDVHMLLARCCVLFAVLASTMTMTLSAADQGREIVLEAQTRTEVASQRYEGLLQVFDTAGKVSDKRWTLMRLGSHGRSKAVLRFTAPAEVKGVALLIVNHPDRASDQWMWTPAIERDRRIALQDRSTRFFGTDFSFEDLEERDIDHYEYSMSGEEAIEGEPCWRIEARPRPGKKSQYTRSVMWIRKNYTYAQMENYSEDKLIRRLKYRRMENAQGIWTARTLEIEDFTRSSRTILKLESLKYNLLLTDDQFSVQALRRG